MRVVQTDLHAFQLHGEFDLAAAAGVFGQLSTAIGDGDLEVDCSGLTFIDAAGLRVFLAVHQQCQRQGAKLVLVNPAGCLTRLLELTRLDGELTVRLVWSSR